MTTGRRRRAKSLPRTTTVSFNAGGAIITVEQLPANKAGPVLKAIIDVVRGLQKGYPELRNVHPTVGGYSPVEYVDDWSGDEAGKIGFRKN